MISVCARRALAIGVVAVPAGGRVGVAHAEDVEAVTLCAIAADPAHYDHRLVQVSGTFAHGFEGFTIQDSSCPAAPVGFWLEYGGSFGSGTVFAGEPSSQRHRDQSLVVQDIPTALVQDALFRRFDRIVHQRRVPSGDVTVVARYFAGERVFGNGPYGGYGHLSCCTLLVVQQVLAVKQVD